MTISKLEDKLLWQIKACNIRPPVREFKFHSARKWRFDFAWPDLKLAVEVEGGIYSGGRHTRGQGFENDCIKYGSAMELGWNVYRCTGEMIKSGIAINTIQVLIDFRNE